MKNFVTQVLEAGGDITPLIIPAEHTNGTGTFNPSIYNDNGRLLMNMRHCQVTIYHSELNVFLAATHQDAGGCGVGATYSGPAGVWASANYLSATGATSVVAVNGATFYITGVQMEQGPFAAQTLGRS